MTIRFTLTFRDLLAFCRYHYPRSPFVIGTFLFCMALLTVPLTQALFADPPKDLGLVTRTVAFIVFEMVLASAIVMIFGVSIVLSMISRRNKTYYAERTLTIADTGISSESQYGKTEVKWTIVQKLARNRRYIFAYTAQHAAYIIPRRAFSDEAQFDAFFTFCEQRIGRS